MVSILLMVVSAGIIMLLGVIHLIYTFYGVKLTPRDPELRLRMQQASLVITQQTTIWQAWLGFNASHSLGAILFGLIYLYLAIAHPGVLFTSHYLLVVGFIMLLGLLILAKKYWFRIPLIGISLSMICYIGSIVI